METISTSEITCPNCGHKKEEEMPTTACQFFYECENCKTVLKPKEGDCCVFCRLSTDSRKQKLLLKSYPLSLLPFIPSLSIKSNQIKKFSHSATNSVTVAFFQFFSI